ncbi:MAG TPA: VanZ family protein [Steroidobacteraceae bacterium]|nr:VanZ family protein [Steroidobacteraceae bacterium]
MNLNRLWWILGFVLVGLVLFVCLIPGKDVPSTPLSDKAEHFIAHFAMAAWFAGLVPRRGWWKILLALVALGVGIEIAQGLMHEGRQADYRDELANFCGGVAGLVVSWFGLSRWPELPAWVLGRLRGDAA